MLPDGAYEAALKSGAKAARSMLARMSGLDALATPTWPCGAAAYQSGGGMPAEQLNLTGVWNATGFPAVALPMGFDGNAMPLSLQLVGRPNADGRLLELADVFQQATDWHLLKPLVDPEARPAPVPDLDGEPDAESALEAPFGSTRDNLSRLGLHATDADLAVMTRTIGGLKAAVDQLTG
ncbi:amidase family protein [Pseudarthrobacter sp. P1]|uniref:amidase family protein n=1 Tax=Pseudarthrobacter sp. P1 TaxID=3418418 RepID=UPI003CF0FBF5